MELPKLLFTIFSLSIVIISPPQATSQCPYPCYPPPIGRGNNSPATPTPPSQGSYPPPATPYNNNPSPVGYYPFNNPPNFYGGSTQPPPDPILPYFPYYFKKPPHKDVEDSSSLALGKSRTLMIILVVASFVILFLFS